MLAIDLLALPLLADAAGGLMGIVFVLGVGFVVILVMLQNLVYVAQPNEALVFSGSSQGSGKRAKGYRIIKNGRGVRIPLFEEVDRLDLTNMPIEVSVTGAYSKGGIPLNVQGVANVKVAGESPALDNAIQRFLGKPRGMIMQIAKETLEGNLRGVLATLTPEQVNGEKDTFARELQKEAEEGLHKLGLTLDTLKIQNVSDDSGYLNSIGRKQTAEIVKSARIAEATNTAQSVIQSANNKQQSELARLEAELNVARAEGEKRVRNAESMQAALIAEQQGQVAALVARATADLKLQDARLAQVKSKLEAEVVAPARAQAEADVTKARGDAAKIVENGKATASALTDLGHQWKKMGTSAKDIFLLQKLDVILPIYLSSIRQIKVDKLTMLQPGSGGSANGASGVVAGLETLRAGTGIDLARAFARWTGIEEARSVVAEAPEGTAPAPRASTPLPPFPPAPVPPFVTPTSQPAPPIDPRPPVARKIHKGK